VDTKVLQPFRGTPCPIDEVREMSYTIGDGMVLLALAGGVVGRLSLSYSAQQPEEDGDGGTDRSSIN
jgi:hypothetical protein